MRGVIGIAAAVLVLVLPAPASHAVVVTPAASLSAKTSVKTGSLRIVVVGDSGGTPGTAAVAGPRGYTKSVTGTKSLKRLRPGVYRVEGKQWSTSLGVVTSSPATKVRVRAGRLTRVKVKFSFAPRQDAKEGQPPVPTAAPPAPDVTAPGLVTGLVATPTGTSVALSWTNPKDADLAGVEVRRAEGPTAPASSGDGTAVPAATNSATDIDVKEKTQYSYAVFAKDASGNTSGPAKVTATTLGVPPGPVTELIGTAVTGHMTAVWKNPVDSDFDAVIVRTTVYTDTLSCLANPINDPQGGVRIAGPPSASAKFETPLEVNYGTGSLGLSVFSQDAKGTINPQPVLDCFPIVTLNPVGPVPVGYMYSPPLGSTMWPAGGGGGQPPALGPGQYWPQGCVPGLTCQASWLDP